MQFPDFEDFLATLTPERIDEIYGGCQSLEIIQISDINDAKNIHAFVSHIMNQTVSHASNLHLNMLRAYHEWLQAQVQ